MNTCPRFYQCSAPICPLDPDRHKRVHLPGDRVCGLAAEAVKPGGEGRLRGSLSAEVVAQVVRAIPELQSRHSHIRKRLSDAAITGSRLDAAARMRAQPIGGVA
jgi:hypothetical protein